MKSVFRKTLLAAATAASLFTLSTAANACSRLVWETDNHGVFVSRTMDWMELITLLSKFALQVKAIKATIPITEKLGHQNTPLLA